MLTSTKKQLPQPETPPLTPRSPSPALDIPTLEDEAQQIPLSSETSEFVDELRELEHRLFERDLPTPLRVGVCLKSSVSGNLVVTHGVGDDQQEVTILQQINNLDSDIPPLYYKERLRIDEMKVEGPLTPNDPPHVDDRTIAWAPYAQVIPHEFDLTSSPTLLPDTKHIKETLDEAGNSLYVKLKYGEVLSADSLSRVTVPEIDPDRFEPGWKGFLDDIGKHDFDFAYYKLVHREIVLSKLLQVPHQGVAQLKDSVPWTWFDHNSISTVMNESFPQDDSAWKIFLDTESEIMDSTSQTWKPAGLRILDSEEDDEDDLEYGMFGGHFADNIATLVKKRKLQIQQNEGHSSSRTGRGHIQNRDGNGGAADNAHLLQNNLLGNLLGGPFSAETSVDNFMEMRGTKKVKLGESRFFSAQSATPNKPSLEDEEAVKVSQNIPNKGMGTARKSSQFPVPNFESPSEAFSIIVSATMLRSSHLLKTLERAFPTIIIIERDFSVHNATMWSEGSVERSSVGSSMDAEADILVSPSMGVIMTSLANAKSAPLPGHKGKSKIRERVERVSPRYEKLLILVSGGQDCTSGVSEGLHPSDVAGLADFITFASSLDCNVTTQYVAGGEEELYRWLMAAIAQNRVPETLLSEQTHWELFLRRAGLNAFAAQSVIALLQAPDGVSPWSPSKMSQFGLTAFVEMDKRMRLTRFGPHCGSRVIQRVSDEIDARWE